MRDTSPTEPPAIPSRSGPVTSAESDCDRKQVQQILLILIHPPIAERVFVRCMFPECRECACRT